MSFNSVEFILCFAGVAGVYFLMPRFDRWRRLWLLAASYAFYAAWRPTWCLLLASETLLTWGVGLALSRNTRRTPRSLLLAAGLAPLLVLAIFKYHLLGWFLHRPLDWPVGISFYTFQMLSYLADVSRGDLPAETDLVKYALYIAFFCQLLSGPVEQARVRLPELDRLAGFDTSAVSAGAKLFLWGLFKKAVLADRLATFVDPVFAHPAGFTRVSLWCASFFFVYQLYCDFSGYSDMAVGLARILNQRLTMNFARPFAASTMSELWRRWHISLTSWVMEYVYKPLAAETRDWGRSGLACSILVAFLLVGLWHGARWTYVVFGLMQGVALTGEALFRRRYVTATRPLRQRLGRLWKALGVGATFGYFGLTCVVFRSASLAQAGEIFHGLLLGTAAAGGGWAQIACGQPLETLATVVGGLLLLELVQWVQAHPWSSRLPAWWSPLSYAALTLLVFNLGVAQEVKFIYVNF